MDNLNGLMAEVEKMKRDMLSKANMLTSNFHDITKKFNFVKEKKTKLNRMPATMMQSQDKSIMIVFDNPEDSDKFFGK